MRNIGIVLIILGCATFVQVANSAMSRGFLHSPREFNVAMGEFIGVFLLLGFGLHLFRRGSGN